MFLLLTACAGKPHPADTDVGADTGGAECTPNVEICNGADDDCDGVVDEEPADAATIHTDADADGFGDPATARVACPSDGTEDGTDCDDAAANVYPGAEDTRWDGIDQDCDGYDRDCADAGPVYVGDLRLEDADLEGFCATYGSVDGDVRIDVVAADLSGLECLCEVTGWLNVAANPALVSLRGLDGLARVGQLSLRSNVSLTTVDGLEQLRTVGEIDISDNPLLVDLSALGGVHGTLWRLGIWSNASLPDLRGLEGITAVGDADGGGIDLIELPSLTSLDGLDGLRSLGSLDIRDTGVTDLEALAGLEDASRISLDGAGINDVSGLRNLQQVEILMVSDTTSLTTLDGMASLSAISEQVHLENNTVLSDISILAATDAELDTVELRDNPAIVDLTSLLAIEQVEHLSLQRNGLTTLTGLEGLRSVDELTIEEPALVDMSALSMMGLVSSAEIRGTELTSLVGLDLLRSIEYLDVLDNPFLVDLTALTSVELTHVEIGRNAALSSLAGLSEIQDESNLWVHENDTLTTLDGFVAPRIDMWYLTVSGNPVLTDISAISGLRRLDRLTVIDNPLVATSDAEALCAEYGLTYTCTVSGNAP